jgi:hypothetical protein
VFVAIDVGATRREARAIGRLYGRIFPSVFHK